jgi:hypothetical protein
MPAGDEKQRHHSRHAAQDATRRPSEQGHGSESCPSLPPRQAPPLKKMQSTCKNVCRPQARPLLQIVCN